MRIAKSISFSNISSLLIRANSSLIYDLSPLS
jgi:hypothetical protein